ncbi:hypothetical protein AD930_06840 [Acetobacter malorum]|nr:hypothetical protein [Acetobacter malorum]KXV06809.1 hypothetical protein AD930_06840 [Acetobacter malorum]
MMMTIMAEVHSDDFRAKNSFDATPFFAKATAKEVSDLIKCDWRGDYAADAVAHAVEQLNPEVARVLQYAALTDDCGFEVSVEPRHAIAWIVTNRPDLPMGIEDQLRKDAPDKLEEVQSEFRSFRRIWIEMTYVVEELTSDIRPVDVEQSVMAWDMMGKLERQELSSDQRDRYQSKVGEIMEECRPGSSEKFSHLAGQIAFLAVAGTHQNLEDVAEAYDEVLSVELSPENDSGATPSP